MQQVLRTIRNYSYVIVIALPLAILLKLVNVFGVNVPYADHWALVPLFMKLDSHTFGFHDLWVQHNEHRIFFPRIIALTLGRATHWYTPAEILFSIVVAVVGIVLISIMLKNSYKNKVQLSIAVLIMSLWFFSPIQWQNWLWGWQIEWFMCITSVIATVYFLDRFSLSKSVKAFWAAVIFATIATFSLGSGIFIWLIGLVLLGCSLLFKKVAKKSLILWGGVGLVETFAYYYHYHKPLDSPSVTLIFHYPGQFIKFFITTLGRPVTSNYEVAYLFGLIIASLLTSLFVISIVARKKINWVNNIKWYAFILYGIIALLGTSVTRLGLGLAGAMGSRYTAFSLLIIIGLTGSLLLLAKDLKLRQNTQDLVLAVICIISLPLIVQSYTMGISEMRVQSKLFSDIKKCTSIDYPTDHCLTATFPPSADAARTWLKYLKEKHYGGY